MNDDEIASNGGIVGDGKVVSHDQVSRSGVDGSKNPILQFTDYESSSERTNQSLLGLLVCEWTGNSPLVLSTRLFINTIGPYFIRKWTRFSLRLE